MRRAEDGFALLAVIVLSATTALLALLSLQLRERAAERLRLRTAVDESDHTLQNAAVRRTLELPDDGAIPPFSAPVVSSDADIGREYVILGRRRGSVRALPSWADLAKRANGNCTAWRDASGARERISSRTCLTISRESDVFVLGNLVFDATSHDFGRQRRLAVAGSASLGGTLTIEQDRYLLAALGDLKIDTLRARPGGRILVISVTGSVTIGALQGATLCRTGRSDTASALRIEAPRGIRVGAESTNEEALGCPAVSSGAGLGRYFPPALVAGMAERRETANALKTLR